MVAEDETQKTRPKLSDSRKKPDRQNVDKETFVFGASWSALSSLKKYAAINSQGRDCIANMHGKKKTKRSI